jgi:hypothetical protein
MRLFLQAHSEVRLPFALFMPITVLMPFIVVGCLSKENANGL